MSELLVALTNAVNSFTDKGDIDMETVNKLVDIIPIMKNIENKDVARAIIRENHNNETPGTIGNKSNKV